MMVQRSHVRVAMGWNKQTFRLALEVCRQGERIGALVLRASESDHHTGQLRFDGLSIFTEQELQDY